MSTYYILGLTLITLHSVILKEGIYSHYDHDQPPQPGRLLALSEDISDGHNLEG